MSRINVLDKSIAELIAAGEVVERPSSVIKELVENSIDAGAKVITVEIRGGGIKFMRVTDNGGGIEREDVAKAFLRHATSKIAREDDLDSILTLGFRGEALASIAAVSHVELLTKTSAERIGTKYVSFGSEDFEIEDAGCPDGTTIIIRDLFFNMPARMKFLKKDVTEGNSIAGIIDKLVLANPDISFRFIRDGKEALHSPGDSKLPSAIYSVYGKDFIDNMIPVDYSYNNVKVTGYICKPSAARPNRSMQNFFINSRYVRSKTAGVAVDEAYKGSVMVGKFASCVLNIELSFEAVDVNVHPAKLEVRFVNERPIFDAVYHGVKSALAKGDVTKTMSFKKPLVMPDAPAEKAAQMIINEPAAKPFVKSTSFADSEGRTEINRPSDDMRGSIRERVDSIIDITPVPEITPKNESHAEPTQDKNIKIIGEAFDTYIIIEYGKNDLMFIDKHAAHERLLYERLKTDEAGKEAQKLLVPVTVTLDKNEYSAVISNLDLLTKAGFETDDFGTGVVLVRTAPMILGGADVSAAIMEIAGYLAAFKTDITTNQLDWIYHNVACRAAIKAGNKSTQQELIALAKELEENPEIRYCPHGRPVSMIVKRSDIEKQFGRI